MASKSKSRLRALLSRGYFPEGLPPPFSTESFADFVNGSLVKYRQVQKFAFPKKGVNTASLCIYQVAKNGSLKRTMAIVNPPHFFRLADLVSKHWNDLRKVSDLSTLSRTKPKFGKLVSERAIVRENDFDARVIDRAHARATESFVLHADIEKFFPSIYTHAIAWAIHTKPIAKAAWLAHSLHALWGNELDRAVSSAQDGQTIGLPIGPDTSRVLAEVLLGRVDSSLPIKVRKRAFRYVDDYEFAIGDHNQAEQAQAALQAALHNYQLSINPRKTLLLKLPQPLDQKWTSELRAISRGDAKKPKEQFSCLQNFFERVYGLVESNPGESVVVYAMTVLGNTEIHDDNWDLVETAACQLVIREPAAIPRFLELLIAKKRKGQSFHTKYVRRLFDQIIRRHAPLGHSNYVAWAIWGSLVLKLKISKGARSKIATMRDSVVALLSLHAQQEGLAWAKGTSISNWLSCCVSGELKGDMWLLAYEATHKKWIPATTTPSYLAADPYFGALSGAGVSFYRIEALKEWRDLLFGKSEPNETIKTLRAKLNLQESAYDIVDDADFDDLDVPK